MPSYTDQSCGWHAQTVQDQVLVWHSKTGRALTPALQLDYRDVVLLKSFVGNFVLGLLGSDLLFLLEWCEAQLRPVFLGREEPS